MRSEAIDVWPCHRGVVAGSNAAAIAGPAAPTVTQSRFTENSQQVAFGRERTSEQDSTFAFRVIVDVGIKALSPAINDPTTAVLAVDQLRCCGSSVGVICTTMRCMMRMERSG
jgi:uncharacterized membrane protein